MGAMHGQRGGACMIYDSTVRLYIYAPLLFVFAEPKNAEPLKVFLKCLIRCFIQRVRHTRTARMLNEHCFPIIHKPFVIMV